MPAQATVRIANENVRRNDFADRINIMIGDIVRPPIRLAPGSFDHAMANPPYLEAVRATAPPNAARAGAHVEAHARREREQHANGQRHGLGHSVEHALVHARAH